VTTRALHVQGRAPARAAARQSRAAATRLALATLLCTLSSACGTPPATDGVDVATVRADLAVVARARILLGHQSVGRDILAGVRTLAAEAGVPLRIVEIDGAPPDDLPGIFHSNIGRNGDPEGKCEVFLHLLDRPDRPRYDLAMMKFCYVDLSADAKLDAARLLERYAALVAGLTAARPDVPLLHVTMPLRADPPGWRTSLKRWLGRDAAEDADNALRNAFNTGLRSRFPGAPLFDLAEVESTRPDGSRSAFTRDGRAVYTLAPDYTTDGGHLNAAGQRRTAAALLHAVAASLSGRR